MVSVRAELARDIAPDEYTAIRELWKAHSIAEDARDLDDDAPWPTR